MNPVKVSNSVSLAANFSFRTHPAIHQFFKILTPHQSISSFISLQLILNPNWPHSEQLPLSGENTSLLMPVLAMCTAVPNRRLDLSVGTATFPPHQKNKKKKTQHKTAWSVAKTTTGRFFKIGSCCLTYSWCSHVIPEHANVCCPSVIHSAATHC